MHVLSVRHSSGEAIWCRSFLGKSLKQRRFEGKVCLTKCEKKKSLGLSPVLSQKRDEAMARSLFSEHMVSIIMQTNFGDLWRKQTPLGGFGPSPTKCWQEASSR